MKKEQLSFSYEVFGSVASLPEADRQLLNKAKEVTQHAYAPYSEFFVGAAALLQNGKTITGTNQENASSPVGLCAERVLLSAAVSLYPGTPIQTIAISYFNKKGKSEFPAAPCGICRQSLLEYELRQQQPIRLILGGIEGKVFVISDVKTLLPLYFSGADMA
ncbi:cytidine deaminase [Agriterribacter sp.]|uniref:cytidine deaminase n=1 Tax=Agriterribacter sp. TaxID=2821509 RepID=UPI002B911D63|nr:cytidine deaminase [Agriterribacter sp.]HRO45028.1 cytidine deaminase [Agriterribacter sp.]HRQ15531.1 cytidine deaminase [Agriterribacter sp.]